MQSCTPTVAATVALGIALALGTAAMAADLPKEGSFSGTYAAFGTVKAAPMGKERLLLTFDQNGLSVGDGLLNHMTWHCWGLGDFTNGTGQSHGYCMGTDPAGEQVAINWGDEKHPLDQKTVTGSFTFTSGTGKYAGITGSGTYVDDGSEFRSTTEGTSFSHNTHHGSYKVP